MGLVGGPKDATLHAPRFYVPGMAGQLRIPLELRRNLCHWGPSSKMLLQYDQSRCVTELATKNDIWKQLENGFIPAEDFEILEIPSDNIAKAEAHRDAHKTIRSWTVVEPKPQGQAETERCTILINHKSWTIHYPGCRHIRDPTAPHIEEYTEEVEKLSMYVRCSTCFGVTLADWAATEMEAPEWDEDLLREDEADENDKSDTDSGVDSASSSSSSSI